MNKFLSRSLIALLIVLTLSVGVAFAKELELGSSYPYATVGPKGEEPTSYDQLELTPEDREELKSQDLKAAIALHQTTVWTNAVQKGIEDMFAELGVEIVTVTNAEMDPQQQTNDIENALARQPDILITLPIDPVSAAAALRPAVNRGTEVVLISNLPQGFQHGDDYAGIVTSDFFQIGKLVADKIADSLDGEGKVALMYHDANYYVTNQRDKAVKATLQRDYPDIEIVTEEGIANPNDGDVVASAILNQHPEVDAIYAPWATIANGVLSAVRTADREDVGIFTIDLDNSIALNMAKGGNVKGIVSDLPYLLGKGLVKVGALGVLGKETPAFTTVPAVTVDKGNLKEKWQEVLKEPLPEDIAEVLESN